MKRRKPIQILHHFDERGKYFILALCDDGTIWLLDGLYEGTPKWEPFPAVPCCDRDYDMDGNCDWHPGPGAKTILTQS